jgi:hypothetical protein
MKVHQQEGLTDGGRQETERTHDLGTGGNVVEAVSDAEMRER